MTSENYTGRSIPLATDGACSGNPGPGGWGCVVHHLDGENTVRRQALAGRATGITTNQRMELTAAIEGLRLYSPMDLPITVISDSRYLVDGMTAWMPNWVKRGWRGADNKPVKNQDLWRTLDQLVRTHSTPIQWQWVRGHDGHQLNDDADMLASNAMAGVYGQPMGPLRDFHPGLFS